MYETKDGDILEFVVLDPASRTLPRASYDTWDGGYEIEFRAYIEGAHSTELPSGGAEDILDPEMVGILFVAYKPGPIWDLLYPTVWHWIARTGGMGFRGDLRPKDIPPDWNPDVDSLFELLMEKRVWGNRYGTWGAPLLTVEDTTREERIALLHDFLDQYYVRERMAYAYKRDVDKPHVSWIHVDKAYKRKGIATSLYNYAARWLAANYGLRLYAGGGQGPAAKEVWKYLMSHPAYPTGRQQVRSWYRDVDPDYDEPDDVYELTGEKALRYIEYPPVETDRSQLERLKDIGWELSL